jgi:tetratricopeptide (TPR) repeat protein
MRSTGLFLSVMLVVAVALPLQAGPAAAPLFDSTRVYSEETFAAAIRPYETAIARNANDADAHYWLGVAYMHVWRLYKFGLAPYAAGYNRRAVVALERALQLRATPVFMVRLLEAYGAAGDRRRYDALFDRVGALAQPIPLK